MHGLWKQHFTFNEDIKKCIDSTFKRSIRCFQKDRKRKRIYIRRSEKRQNMSNVVEKLLPRPDLQKCSICSRHFTLDRIKAHETICQKTSGIVRKSFDVSQQRIKGTETERFTKMAARKKCFSKLENNCPWGLSTNWRRKHEDLMKKVKDAKETAYERGPNTSTLPFPPPMDYDKDYVQCQYCSRKFNSVSAARHITACANRMCTTKSKTNLADDSNPTASQTSLADK